MASTATGEMVLPTRRPRDRAARPAVPKGHVMYEVKACYERVETVLRPINEAKLTRAGDTVTLVVMPEGKRTVVATLLIDAGLEVFAPEQVIGAKRLPKS